MKEDKFAKLKRSRYPIPGYIQKALKENALEKAFEERPAYQQNDYIGWITRAKRQETIDKRLAQMLNELEIGDRYMKMPYHSKSQ
jgi:uncharacterized protein YdeI (YjbR/CyaY-like superfamily)